MEALWKQEGEKRLVIERIKIHSPVLPTLWCAFITPHLLPNTFGAFYSHEKVERQAK